MPVVFRQVEGTYSQCQYSNSSFSRLYSRHSLIKTTPSPYTRQTSGFNENGQFGVGLTFWALYDMTIQHLPGSQHRDADGLSKSIHYPCCEKSAQATEV